MGCIDILRSLALFVGIELCPWSAINDLAVKTDLPLPSLYLFLPNEVYEKRDEAGRNPTNYS